MLGRNSRALFLTCLLLGVSFFSLLPEVHAQSVVQSTHTETNAGGSTLTCTFSSAVSASDVIIISAMQQAQGDTTGPITDTLGSTYTEQANALPPGASTHPFHVAIWTATGKSGASDTITINFGSTAARAASCEEVSGLTSKTLTSSSSGTTLVSSPGAGATITTSVSSFTPATHNLLVEVTSAVSCKTGPNPITYPSSFSEQSTATFADNGFCDASNDFWQARIGTAFNFDYAGGASTFSTTWTNPTASNAITNIVELVAGFSAQTATTNTVIPCTFFQLQCWWYPLFFFGVYTGLMMAVAKASQVPERDYASLFLEGLSMATLIAVIMGMLNIMFPLIITAVQVVRALRS